MLAPLILGTLAALVALYLWPRSGEDLEKRDRQVLVLFELEGRSGREVAELLQVKLDAVWVLRHRARQRFAAAMKEAGHDC